MSISRRVAAAQTSFTPVADFYFRSRYGQRRFEPGIADLTFGNPQEMPLAGLVDVLRQSAMPRDKNWFAYKTSEVETCDYLADSVGRELGLGFDPEDFAVTA